MKYKLICFDMDGVIFKHENFWYDLHKAWGTYDKGEKLTREYIAKDYAKLVEEVVVKLWKGRNADKYFELVQKSEYTKGVKETFVEIRKQGIKIALITSGPVHLAMRAKEELGIDFIFSNELVIRNNIVTGEFRWPIGFGQQEKLRIVSELVAQLGISFNDVAYIGDHDNDIGICQKVGLSIAFNSKSEELDKVCTVVVKQRDLRHILKHLK